MRFWEWLYVGEQKGLVAEPVWTHHLFPTELAQQTCWDAVQTAYTACGHYVGVQQAAQSDLPRCSECQRVGKLREQAFEEFSKGSIENPLLWGRTDKGRGIHLAPASMAGFCGREIESRVEEASSALRCTRCLRAAERYLRKFKT